MMKVGIIRCMQTEVTVRAAPGFQMIREQKGAFAGQEDIEIVGFINCGGCPGKSGIACAGAAAPWSRYDCLFLLHPEWDSH